MFIRTTLLSQDGVPELEQISLMIGDVSVLSSDICYNEECSLIATTEPTAEVSAAILAAILVPIAVILLMLLVVVTALLYVVRRKRKSR